MRFLTQRLGLAVIGIVFALAAHSQPGGGFGGGGFGGGGAGGFGQDGLQNGDTTDSGNDQNEEIDMAELLRGRWQIEFRVDYFSADPEANGRYLEVYAEIYVNGDLVEGRIQEDNIRGTFRCNYDGQQTCDLGTMRFQGEEQDWQDFGFRLDRYGDRATGWAEFVNIDTGEIQRFELRMRKR